MRQAGKEWHMKTILVDSNHELRSMLANLLSLFRVFRIEAEFDTVGEAMDYIQCHETDVIFSNIQPASPRASSDGIYLSAILSRSHPYTQVVVYSDTKEGAYAAYHSQCAGYLLLPFDSLALQGVVGKLQFIYELQQAKKESARRSIMIRTKSGYQLTRIQDILFVEYRDRKNRAMTVEGKEILLSGYTMNELESLLKDSGFYRCYQSFIVNLSRVSFIRANNDAKSYAIQFKDCDREILLSRDKYTELVELLKSRYAGIQI